MNDKENKINEISNDDLIKEIKIGLDDVENFVNGYILENDFPINLKQHCIFRGVSDYNHKLVPKALRKEKDGKYVICNYIHQNASKDYHSAIVDGIECDNKELTLELQYRREFFILFRFLDWADKSGLKVPEDRKIRKLLHSYINHPFDGYWPQSRFYEVIALAQHNGLPTCALDWSYNYKVSLYFAVRKILKKDMSKCVLWAFNYKYFEKKSEYVVKTGIEKEKKPQLRFYRPQYYYNDNLKAQKGLFTFLINNEKTFNPEEIKPLEEFVCDMVKEVAVKNRNSKIEVKLPGIAKFTLEKNERIFYKFVIEGEAKEKILEKLYSGYYSEEYLFPGYKGVADAMKNWADLQNLKEDKSR